MTVAEHCCSNNWRAAIGYVTFSILGLTSRTAACQSLSRNQEQVAAPALSVTTPPLNLRPPHSMFGCGESLV
ncbi:unnamed protein product [Clavelina lepadiformis]|uniref:Uncharacterized protein n=1 Tax=Clavelina lepadiformis TaxID=159417 RepID=A0ABP0GEX4_CLALP